MKLKTSITLIVFQAFFLFSCAEKKNADVSLNNIDQPEVVGKVSFGMGNDLIKKIIVSDTLTKSVSINKEVLFSQKSLPKFYQRIDYALAWEDYRNRADLLECIEKSYTDGLLPSDYHLEKIKLLINKKYEALSEEERVYLDLYLTDAVLLLGSHFRMGKVDQKTLRTEWDIEHYKAPAKVDSLLVEALLVRGIKSGLEKVKPKHPMYGKLKEKLIELYALKEQGGWNKVIGFEDKIEVGDSSTAIPSIIKRLQVTGEFKGNFPTDSLRYGDGLKKAVMLFQKKHNLTADGIIGKGTVEQMNIPVEKRIETIKVNLERFRWVLDENLDDFLAVNIAGFKVYRYTHNKIVFESRVIVGKYHKESPIFRDKMEYIILNPTWTLPYSIATHETLPRLKKNPGYLAAKHMEIMDRNGNVLNPYNIDFSQYSSGKFPFTIRQKAGPWNALGEVKFIFPNKYSVYLHDTPSRTLFDKQDRAFSHGCIRTEDKWGLLLNLMKPTGEWNMDRINTVLKSGETTRINLPKPIDILLLYFTASVDRNGNLNFNKDVYNRDAAVLKALNKPYQFKQAK